MDLFKGSLCFLLLVVIIAVSTVKTSPLVNTNTSIYRRDIADHVTAGLEVGTTIADFFESKQFGKALNTIAKSVGKFLGVISPFVGLIMGLLPGAESAELQYMKKMMKRIDERFDDMDVRFDEVERLIRWTSVEVNFGELEHTILSLARDFEIIYEVPPNARENKKSMFINLYETDYGNSGYKLYQAVIKPNIFQENLGSAIMRYCENDLGKTQGMLGGVIKLLLQAAKIELAYLTLKNFNTLNDVMKTKWESRILEVEGEFASVNEQVKDNFHIQAGKDVKNILKEHSELSNKDFSNNLYNFLTQKYFWRDWLVAAYKPITGHYKHYNRVCNGFIKYNQNGRNLIIASQDKSTPHINRNKASTEIHAVISTAMGPYIRQYMRHQYITDFAKTVNNQIKLPDVCAVIVIQKKVDVWFKYGNKDRFVANNRDYVFKIVAWG